MSFFKRLFSADYRAAVSAEAAGQLEQAAERYVLAGERAEAVRVHLARAERAPDRTAEIAALRDALHWATDIDAAVQRRIQRSLGRAMLARVRAEGVATQRDRDLVREAAERLLAGEDFQAAGEAFESIGDTQRAAQAYTSGGLVEQMEAVLARDEAALMQQRALRDGYASYEMHMRLGERDAARDDLRRCLESTDKKLEYRRLLDDLESRLITGGVVRLRPRHRPVVAVCAVPAVRIGRDSLCELPLRAGGISRQHVEIAVGAPDARPRFMLRDLGSRNGTFLGGMRLSGAVPVPDAGTIALGDDCTIELALTSAAASASQSGVVAEAEAAPGSAGAPQHLVLKVTGGLDRDVMLLAGGEHERIALEPLVGVPALVELRGGRPFLLRSKDGVSLELGGEPIAHGAVQLIHGDELVIDGVEIEVA